MVITTWLAFVAASTLLLLLPGPNRPAGAELCADTRAACSALATVAGVALGDAVAMTASSGLGWAPLSWRQPSYSPCLKWAGAGLYGAILAFSFCGVLEVRDLRASNRRTCRSRQ